MDRLLSEQAVIETIKEWSSYIFTTPTGDLLKLIKAIPSAEPNNCPYDKNGYCYSDDSCGYKYGDNDEFCGVHEETSAEPYKGMTNGEVLHKIFPNDLWLHIYARRARKNADWWNSPYEPQESEE